MKKKELHTLKLSYDDKLNEIICIFIWKTSNVDFKYTIIIFSIIIFKISSDCQYITAWHNYQMVNIIICCLKFSGASFVGNI